MTANEKYDEAEGRFGAAAQQVSSAASAASSAVVDAAGVAGQKVSQAASAVGETVSHAAHVVSEKAADTAAAVRDGATDAYDAARQTAYSARDSAADGLDSSPLAFLAGGIALGAIIGALLPKTVRETEILGPVAVKAADAARAAFSAARTAGQEKLDELGINKEAARAKVDQLVDTASQAATSAGVAAKDAVRNRSEA